jgi:DNA polymerase I
VRINATTADAYNLVHNGILALARAERQGIRIDTEYCERKKKHLERKIKYLEKKLENSSLYRRWKHIYGAKTNIYSNYQLAKILYKVMKIEPPKMTDKGDMGATDEDALNQIDVPELKDILQIRKLAKVKETYLGSFIREETDGFMHPFFNLHTVRTHRSSSSDPNFQNIPKRDKEAMAICRRAIIPRPGHMLLEADFSALEVMISCCYHKDPVMLNYVEDKNSDMHLDMAKQIFMFDTLEKKIPVHSRLRQAAKNGFVFPQFYGDYYGNNARGIMEWVGLPQNRWKKGMGVELPDGSHISDHFLERGIRSFNEFTEHLKEVEDDFWNNRFRVYNAWRKEWVEKYRKQGYLQMLTGFVCSGVMRKNEIINYPIQGTAFHCLLLTFTLLDEAMQKEGWDSKLIGQIHDSIVMDVNPDEREHIENTAHRIVREELPKIWNWINVPLEIEITTYGVDKPWIESAKG